MMLLLFFFYAKCLWVHSLKGQFLFLFLQLNKCWGFFQNWYFIYYYQLKISSELAIA